MIPTGSFNDKVMADPNNPNGYLANPDRKPDFLRFQITNWYGRGATVGVFSATRKREWAETDVIRYNPAKPEALCNDKGFEQTYVRGPKTIEELTQLLNEVAKSGKKFHRLTLMGHATTYWDERPGVRLVEQSTSDSDKIVDSETITDELVAAIQKVLEPGGTLRLGGCSAPDKEDLTTWQQSLQKLADRLQRRVIISAKLAGLDNASGASADVWTGAEPRAPVPDDVRQILAP
jgi:hypothetical protein